MKNEKDFLGTVISTIKSPSPSAVDFVVTNKAVHRGQYVEIDYEEGKLVCLVTNVLKTNRYFERADSVKEFENSGTALFEQFPTAEWEYLVAEGKPLGIFKGNIVKRPNFPPSPGARVKIASAETLKKFLNFDESNGLHLGEIEEHSVKVMPSLNSLLRKHLAILAMSGGGKCASPHTRVLLSSGEEIEIGKLVESAISNGFSEEEGVQFAENKNPNIKVFSLSEKNEIVESDVKVFARRKAPNRMVRAKTSSGRVLELTPEHLVPVLASRIKWVPAENLADNYILLPKPNIFGSDQTIDICFESRTVSFKKTVAVDEDFAKLFAYMLAEGHNSGKCISFTNSSKEIMADFSGLCEKVFGLQANKLKRQNEARIFRKALALALQQIGFTNSSWTKYVPRELLKSKKHVIGAFLSGFIDCDGHVSKSTGLEICLASKEIINAINLMLLRLGIVPRIRQKKVNDKKYSRLFVSSAKDLRILRKYVNLRLAYKTSALDFCCVRVSNTNVDTIPNMNENILRIIRLLNMSHSQTRSSGITNYLYRNDNPSFPALQNLVSAFEERVLFLESKIQETKTLFFSLPNFFEEDAKQIVSDAYGRFNFNQISNGSGVSPTTARRVVRSLTAPTRSSFALARQALLLQEQRDVCVDIVSKLDYSELATKIKGLCADLGFEIKKICKDAGVNKCYLYETGYNLKGGTYSSLYNVVKKLFVETVSLEKKVEIAKKEISFLKGISESNLFFDRVVSAEYFEPDFEYVYDLSVEHANFCANNLIIHNSHFVSCLIEELLDRKKEQGRIAVVALDPHGEYSSFALKPRSSGKNDYSTRTKIVRAREVKIGVPRLSVNILAGIIPGVSSAQKRELGRIISVLNREMKQGTGPYGLAELRQAVSGDTEMNENTKTALVAWVSSLQELNLFSKTDSPSIFDVVKPGQLTVVDLSDIIDLRKKQIIVSYFAQRLFSERRQKAIPPFLLVVEESHQFIPEKAKAEQSVSKGILRTIAREGRKFGASLCLVSQRPVQLDTTTLSQCATNIILRISNPYDLKHIGESSEALDSRSLEMITSLRVGEALLVGEAVGNPVFFKVRERRSEKPSHEISLEETAIKFEEGKEKQEEETQEFL